MNKLKIGFYSGTFDPVHVGHIEFALQAVKQCSLGRVLLLPEPSPREKTGVTEIGHRLNMLSLASRGHKNLEVVQLNTEQFTVQETLPVLQAIEPNAQLVYLCGSDVVRTFLYRWPGLRALLQKTEIIVGLRNEDSAEEMLEIFEELEKTEGVKIRFTLLKAPRHRLASTMVRNDTHTINDIDPAVAVYIVSNKLYS